jgi:DNA-binding transcriptional LysR family regulator
MPDDLVNFDFNLLIPLHALLAERNVTKAAERASVGQPSMSASLAKLRRHFDDPLLVREGRGMALTSLAASLVKPVDEIIARVSVTIRANAQFEPDGVRRRFTIAANDSVSVVLLRPLIAAFNRESVNVELRVVSLRESADRLRSGEYDLVISSTPVSDIGDLDAFSAESLFTDEFVAVVARDCPDVGDIFTVEQACSLPLVHVVGADYSVAHIGLSSRPLRPQVAATVEDYMRAAYLVADTRMITFLPCRLFDAISAAIGLRRAAVRLPLRPDAAVMYWHPQNTAHAGHTWLRDRMRQVSAKL